MTKAELKQYYKNLQEIEAKEKCIKNLKEELNKLNNSDDVTLNADLQGVKYYVAPTSGGQQISQQDKAINEFYYQREQKKKYLQVKIFEIESDIFDLEIQNVKIESILSYLDSEELRLIELYFKEKKTGLQIGFILNMCASTVHRKIQKLLKKMDYEEV